VVDVVAGGSGGCRPKRLPISGNLAAAAEAVGTAGRGGWAGRGSGGRRALNPAWAGS
jgi:hypothetical protein